MPKGLFFVLSLSAVLSAVFLVIFGLSAIIIELNNDANCIDITERLWDAPEGEWIGILAECYTWTDYTSRYEIHLNHADWSWEISEWNIILDEDANPIGETFVQTRPILGFHVIEFRVSSARKGLMFEIRFPNEHPRNIAPTPILRESNGF